MIDSGASVNVCPKWFGTPSCNSLMVRTCLRGANGEPLQEYRKATDLVENLRSDENGDDFHVVDVTKPILSVSRLCEHGVETHLAKKSFLRFW